MRRGGKRNAAVVSNRVSRHEGMPISDEICEDCGALVAEPNAPHTRRDCEKCGNTSSNVTTWTSFKPRRNNSNDLRFGQAKALLELVRRYPVRAPDSDEESA